MAKGKWQMAKIQNENPQLRPVNIGAKDTGKTAFQPKDTRERAFQFALRVVHLCDFLDARPGSGRTLARQLLKAATSVGANLEEAQAGHSKADFICKTEIALKEARETRYWLRLIAATELVSSRRIGGLQREAEELSRILAAIVLSAKEHR